jgi:hypothetical protein
MAAVRSDDGRSLHLGLAEWFEKFCDNIQVADGGTTSARYKRISKRMNLDFWKNDSETAHSPYVGSYGRNTAIKGFSDLAGTDPPTSMELAGLPVHRYTVVIRSLYEDRRICESYKQSKAFFVGANGNRT